MSISTKTLELIQNQNLSKIDQENLINALQYESNTNCDYNMLANTLKKSRFNEAKKLSEYNLDTQQKYYAKKLKSVNQFIANHNLNAIILNSETKGE